MNSKNDIHKWPEVVEGEKSLIIRTTKKHLAQFTKWQRWEGHFGETEGTPFATQNERVRRLKALENKQGVCLSILNRRNNELTSLIELYEIKNEVYATNLVIAEKTGLDAGFEAGFLLAETIFSNIFQFTSIYLDFAEHRVESRKLIEGIGFQPVGYHYVRNPQNQFIKILEFKITRDFWYNFIIKSKKLSNE
ncbi:MAG: hypothetical protein ACXAC7_09595 [Candidatus Hodarchaeales archaeon]|jgi:hypothetical protein